jgi:hypothetical protein
MTQTTVLLDLGEEGPGAERLERQGIWLSMKAIRPFSKNPLPARRFHHVPDV